MLVSRAIYPQHFTLNLNFYNSQDTLNVDALKRGERLGGWDKERNDIEPKAFKCEAGILLGTYKMDASTSRRTFQCVKHHIKQWLTEGQVVENDPEQGPRYGDTQRAI